MSKELCIASALIELVKIFSITGMYEVDCSALFLWHTTMAFGHSNAVGAQ